MNRNRSHLCVCSPCAPFGSSRPLRVCRDPSQVKSKGSALRIPDIFAIHHARATTHIAFSVKVPRAGLNITPRGAGVTTIFHCLNGAGRISPTCCLTSEPQGRARSARRRSATRRWNCNAILKFSFKDQKTGQCQVEGQS